MFNLINPKYILSVFVGLFSMLFVTSVQDIQLERPPTPEEIATYKLPAIEFKEIVPVEDTTSNLLAGLLLAHLPTTNGSKCSSCHNYENSGHGTGTSTKFPFGRRGLFDQFMTTIFGPDASFDVQTMRTPPVLMMSLNPNGLTDGALGSTGMNVGIDQQKLNEFNWANGYGFEGTEAQIIAGMDAHSLEPLERLSKDIPELDSLLHKATPVTNGVAAELRLSPRRVQIINAVAGFERIISPTESNFQLWLQGKRELKQPEGFEIFKQQCIHCHRPPALGFTTRANQIGSSDFEGLKRVTDQDYHYGLVKTPTLYNVKDAPTKFAASKKMTTYKAVLAHNDNVISKVNGIEFDWEVGHTSISKKDARSVAKWIDQDLRDKHMARYCDPSFLQNWVQYEKNRLGFSIK